MPLHERRSNASLGPVPIQSDFANHAASNRSTRRAGARGGGCAASPRWARMRWIDELHLQHPFMGARMLRRMLAQEGILVGRRHIGTLMKRMGIEALAP